jgi:serine/threonine protein kinase
LLSSLMGGEPFNNEQRKNVRARGWQGSVRLEPGAEPIAGYHLVAPVGRSRYGEVWEAERVGGHKVALKFVAKWSPAGIRESAALQYIKNLRHGSLLAVLSSREVENTLVIETELADRSLLDDLVSWRQGSLQGLRFDHLVRYLSETADALDYLHSEEILHMDIKPSNLLLIGGKIRVADYGSMRAADDLRAVYAWLTPQFAAPEVLVGEHLSPKSDQFSLAVTYCLLRCGQFPYAFLNAGIPDYRRLNLNVLPESEREVVAKALNLDWRYRYSSCTEFVYALLRNVGLVSTTDLDQECLEKTAAKQSYGSDLLERHLQTDCQPPYLRKVSRAKPPPTICTYRQLLENDHVRWPDYHAASILPAVRFPKRKP